MRQVVRLARTVFAAGWLLGSAYSQAPTGSIIGTVTDESGAVIPGASVSILGKATGLKRTAVSSADGTFNILSLPAAEYQVRCEHRGFRTSVLELTVETGSTATLDLRLQVGAAAEIVEVEGAAAQVATDSFKVDGVITRQQIQELPLNGRNYLQLAFLEPGVGVSAGSTSQYNSQFNVSILGGSSSLASITVDGGNVRDSIDGNSGINFSQEVVQEFQLSSVNFDLSAPITATGAINIVTRTGGNQFHGSGYYFFRDHNMSAYPALQRNPLNPDPFFARRQVGFWFGGPIKKDKLFFFVNFEHLNQDSVVTVQPNSPFFRDLIQNASSPYTGKQFSPRVDWRINERHSLFVRYSTDRNKAFGPRGGATLPSNWLVNRNYADQGVIGLTSTLKPTLVNDFRATWWYWSNRNLFPSDRECPGCIGLGLPETSILGTNVTFGNTQNATQGRNLRRGNFLNTMNWQKGDHRFKFGGEIELGDGTGFWGYADPAAGAVYGPDFIISVAGQAGLALFGLPNTFRTNEDLLKLPVATYTMGIGNPAQPPPYNKDQARRNDRYRWFFQDAWRIRPRFTLNYGVAWQYETTLVNHDLTKPALVAPLAGGTEPSRRDFNNFTPSLGFAWNVGGHNKTVIRGGAGIYYDTRLLWQRLEERTIIGPLGNGRIPFSTSGVPNPLPGIQGAPQGQPIDYRNGPTGFTLGHFMSILPTIRAGVERSLQPVSGDPNDLSIRVINIAKQGSNLIPLDYPAAYSTHINLGVQHELRRDMVLTVDFVSRQFVHNDFGSLDYNRWLRPSGPVIPRCTSSAQANNPAANCSTGQITFRTPAGRSNYKAMLAKFEKRFSRRYQLMASYALTHQHGVNGLIDMDNWFRTWGPQGARHSLNVSGIVDLPWKFQFSFISSSSSRGPLTPSISGIDLIGSGIDGSQLPGLRVNGINRGLGKEDLAAAVQAFNQQYAGQRTSRGQVIPTLTLPANYSFGDNFIAQDIRIQKRFDFGERYKLTIASEIFNVFNVANLGGYSFDLRNTAAFGQPTSRASQVFGTGGPRAFQLFARFTF